jgi:hypothetical protein
MNVENEKALFAIAAAPSVLFGDSRKLGVYSTVIDVLLFLFMIVEYGDILNVRLLIYASPV